MTVLVLGANGQLGLDVCNVLKNSHDVAPATHADGDIRDGTAMRTLFDKFKPQCVINTAAMHNVPDCESKPEEAYQVNALATKHLAEICAETGAHFIQISTDYVFDGKSDRPYTEDDVARPLNVYGNTKLSGENYALAVGGNAAIVRVGGIYGAHPCRAKGGLNFVQLMLKLAKEGRDIRVVDDEVVAPTPTMAIAAQLQRILEKGLTGVIHATCQGQTTWYDFARSIFALSGISANLQRAAPGEFPVKVKRPQWSVLDNTRLREAGIDVMPDWQEGLRQYLTACGY